MKFMRMDARVLILLCIGFLQMSGDLTRSAPLKAFGAATGASPAPKVFSTVEGLETFSSNFYLDWRDSAGNFHELELTPEIYARIRGPYNRRNVFGAALAYGPVLQANPQTRDLFQSTMRYAACGEAPIVQELTERPIDSIYGVSFRLEPRENTRLSSARFVVAPECK